MYCFRIRAQEDLYTLLVYVMFCFRIRAQEIRKPCYLILVLFRDTNSGSSKALFIV